MTIKVRLDEIVLDAAIRPRAANDEARVAEYVEAMRQGDVFPPVELQRGTNKLVCGWHRFFAAYELGVVEIDAVEIDVDDPLGYAIDQDRRHGLALSNADKRRCAQLLASRDAEFDVETIARQLGCARSTVQNWLSSELAVRRREQERAQAVRQVQVAVLQGIGWGSTRAIGELLGVVESQVRNDAKSGVTAHLADVDLTNEAVAGLATLFARRGNEKPNVLARMTNWVNEQRDPGANDRRLGVELGADIAHGLAFVKTLDRTTVARIAELAKHFHPDDVAAIRTAVELLLTITDHLTEDSE